MAFYKGAAKEGTRAQQLIKKRQMEQEDLERKKHKIEEEMKIGAIANKFAAHYDAVEQKLKTDTIGLVTLTEMKAKQEDVVKARERQIAISLEESRLAASAALDGKDQHQHSAKQTSKLSFNFYDDDEEDDDEEDEEKEKEKEPEKEVKDKEPEKEEKDKEKEEKDKEEEEEAVEWPELPKVKNRLGKDPSVDTSFLPDRDREEEEQKMREELRQQWVARQEKIKDEQVEVTYSYWDGSGHRRVVHMKKGNSMQQFLQKCLENLRKEFTELKSATVNQLMYIKEDLIIPQHYTFYDFIVTKARGKSGPLFNFDVHEDIRMMGDANVEKDESHAGKVCLRSWYERNKHIFPASRWEPYDPEKSWDKYTVSDKEAAKITVK